VIYKPIRGAAQKKLARNMQGDSSKGKQREIAGKKGKKHPRKPPLPTPI